MQFDDAVLMRRSIRKYKPDAVPDACVRALLEAARLAPSGLNVQPWRFAVVKDAAARARLAEATPSRFVAEAPVIMICCVDTEAFSTTGARIAELQTAGAIDAAVSARYGSGESAQNLDRAWVNAQLSMYTGVAIEHMMLKAADLGLGSCWIGMFDADRVREIAGIGARYGILTLLPVGYAAQQPVPRPRLPVSELLLKEI